MDTKRDIENKARSLIEPNSIESTVLYENILYAVTETTVSCRKWKSLKNIPKQLVT